jgi:hypothetical protein
MNWDRFASRSAAFFWSPLPSALSTFAQCRPQALHRVFAPAGPRRHSGVCRTPQDRHIRSASYLGRFLPRGFFQLPSFPSFSFTSFPSFSLTTTAFSEVGEAEVGDRAGERGTTLRVERGDIGGGEGVGDSSSELSSSLVTGRGMGSLRRDSSKA